MALIDNGFELTQSYTFGMQQLTLMQSSLSPADRRSLTIGLLEARPT